VFIVVGVYFFIDSVRKLLDTPSHFHRLLRLRPLPAYRCLLKLHLYFSWDGRRL